MEKEFTLKKNLGIYTLYNSDGSTMANSYKSPHKLLSVSNCDEIFGVVDVEKLSQNEYQKHSVEDETHTLNEEIQRSGGFIVGFKEGFNKAMELNKDKLFTVEDLYRVERCYLRDCDNDIKYKGQIVQRILNEKTQQPTEIKVEIEMIKEEYTLTQNGEGFEDQAYRTWKEVPKLDKNGCIILKRK